MDPPTNNVISPEIFDEYTRRQYVAKAPDRNPFGVNEEPKNFAEFDVFTKLRVLVQLSQWTLINAERMRDRMGESKDTEQIQWVRVAEKLSITTTDRSYGSVSRKLDTIDWIDYILCLMITDCTAEQIRGCRHRRHPKPKRIPRKAKLLHEPLNGERFG